MEQITSSEANSRSDSQEIPLLFWYPSFITIFTRAHFSRGPVKHFVTSRSYLLWGVVSPLPNSQAEEPPLVVCSRLLIQYIPSYLSYLDAFLSIKKQRAYHAVVTGTHLTWPVTPRGFEPCICICQEYKSRASLLHQHAQFWCHSVRNSASEFSLFSRVSQLSFCLIRII
jgi:hypothetical protein